MKFRVWDEEEKKMYNPPNTHIMMDMEGVVVNLQNGVILKPLLFIGLQDKNGVDVCEGDVLELGGEKVKIVWADSLLQFVGDYGDSDFALSEYLLAKAEIISNMHENPEWVERG